MYPNSYFKRIQEETLKGIGVECLQALVEKRVGEELVVLVLDVDTLSILAIDRPDFITRKRLHLADIPHIHLYQLPTLLALFLLILLLCQRLIILPLHPNQIIKHSVGGQEHVLHSLVIDAHRGI